MFSEERFIKLHTSTRIGVSEIGSLACYIGLPNFFSLVVILTTSVICSDVSIQTLRVLGGLFKLQDTITNQCDEMPILGVKNIPEEAFG